MSYEASSYNYCTPLSSVEDFTNTSRVIADNKYFTLHDNRLDGSYYPVSGDVGLWGAHVSDSDGALSTPFALRVVKTMSVRSIGIIGSSNAFPVDMTVYVYNNSNLLRTVDVVGNTMAACNVDLGATYSITEYIVRITRISSPNSVVKLFSSGVFEIITKTSTDRIAISQATSKLIGPLVSRADSLAINDNCVSHIFVNTAAADTLSVELASTDELYNVHSAMKNLTRQIFGKVSITYTDPMLSDAAPSARASSTAYNSEASQVTDSFIDNTKDYFTLYNNDLSGKYTPLSEYSQTGWVSSVLSDANGYFSVPQYVDITFLSRPISDLSIHFDNTNGNIVKDFKVEIFDASNNITSKTFYDNTSAEVKLVTETLSEIVRIKVTVYKVAKANSPAIILDIPIVSTILYKGYQDVSELISIDMLEELTYEDDIEALGGVSANETTIVLDNTSRIFNINNPDSPISKQLRRNRKIVPSLGVEIVPGLTEWYKLGTYWSHSWNVPINSLVATVVGFDTIGLLDTTSFVNHQTLKDYSIGALVDYVMQDAKSQLNFLEWQVAPELYNEVIPYAWFESASHTAALRRISKAYPMHIYCDRDGHIIAAPQKLHLDYYLDKWSDSTNVVDVQYNSLHTVLPNIVNVSIVNVLVIDDTELVKDEVPFEVNGSLTRLLHFSNPYVDNFAIDLDADEGITYSAEPYSWGVALHFSGNGTVRSVACRGTSLDTSNTSRITVRDDTSVYLNGAITRDISAEFIQTSTLASYISNRIFSLSENDKYDAEVTYRGDIALSINDPVLLLDGIAPDNRYNIKRHQLTWDGALTGTANLNT